MEPAAKKARVQEDAPVVVCFGDSNTYGYDSEEPRRIPYASRWVTALQTELGADNALVIPEGLNGRTTVIDDPHENPDFAGLGGAGMNGRRYLLPCLHSHKPVKVVVLALGCNDLKSRHGCGPDDITSGLAALIADVRKVMSPPLCKETPTCLTWGFKGCGEKSKGTIECYREMAKEQGLPFVDLGAAATVGADGIHFQASAGKVIGARVAEAVRVVL